MQTQLTRRSMLKWGLLGTSACVLAACAPKVVEKEVTKVVEKIVTPTTAAKAPAATVNIVCWVNQPWARTEGLWDSVIQEYEETYPGVKVESLIIAFADYEPKMLTALAGGTVGDLLEVHPVHNANMALKGALMPLDDLMPTLGVESSDFTKAWDYNVWRGRRWAIPRADNPGVLMYNRNMVQAAGLPDPVELWKQDKWNIEIGKPLMDLLAPGLNIRVNSVNELAGVLALQDAKGDEKKREAAMGRLQPLFPDDEMWQALSEMGDPDRLITYWQYKTGTQAAQAATEAKAELAAAKAVEGEAKEVGKVRKDKRAEYKYWYDRAFYWDKGKSVYLPVQVRTVKRKDGTRVPVAADLTPIHNADGSIMTEGEYVQKAVDEEGEAGALLAAAPKPDTELIKACARGEHGTAEEQEKARAWLKGQGISWQ